MRSFAVRPFVAADVKPLLGLMRGLAVFEDYAHAFAVTEEDLIEHGLGSQPRFGILVAAADDDGELLGMAVHYVIPWTYDLKPTLVLKELFVAPAARSIGVGETLMANLAREAMAIGAPRITWGVLPHNDGAKRFYTRLGGRPELKFEPWGLTAAAIAALAEAA